MKTTGSENLIQSGFQPGTVEYMSPEQLLGLEVDLRTDIYCLRATFFERFFYRSASISSFINRI